MSVNKALISFCGTPNRALRLLLLAGLLLLVSPAWAMTEDLDQNWQYRWGDSPFVDGKPQWVLQPDHADWQAIDFPSNPPGRNGATNVWYRTQIPDGHWHDPVLYIYSVDLIVQVYQGDRMIYQYGEFDEQGQGSFSGWPWHMIPLPDDVAGQPIYFRIFSNYMDIGLWGEVKIMERLALYQMIWQRSAEDLVITGFTLLIALLSLLFAVHKAQRPVFIPLALFAFSAAGLALTGTQAKQLIWFQPLFWDYLAASSYYLLPVGLILLLSRGFHLLSGSVARGLEIVFVSYFVLAIGLSLTGVVSLSDTYPVFDLIFALLVPLTLILALSYKGQGHKGHGHKEQSRKGLSFDQGVILTASILLTGLLLADMAVAHSWIDWNQIPVGWGTLAFSMALVVLSIRHYVQTQNALEELNSSLEKRVQERTEALNTIAHREARRAEALNFAHQRSEELGQAVTALSQHQEIESAIRFLKPCLPELIQPMPGIIYWFDGEVFCRGESWLMEDALIQQHFPRKLSLSYQESPIQVPEHWHSYQLQYSQLEVGTQPLALIWADTSGTQDELLGIETLALHTLLERGAERLSLTLSQIALKSSLSRFSYEDGLTGLNNRRYLDTTLPRMVQTALEVGSPLAVMICDIDYFKNYNDRFGHVAGDEVLQQAARLMKQLYADKALISRFGGEEFVVVFAGLTGEEAMEEAEKLRTLLSETVLNSGDTAPGAVTISAGVCSLNDRVNSAETLIQCADKALYQAKNGGRDQVVLASAVVETE